MWPSYRQWDDDYLLEALIELFLDETNESCRHVWLLVSLRAEMCADLLGCVDENNKLVHCWVQLWGGKNNV